MFVSDVYDATIPTVGVPCGNGYDYSLCCKVINGWKMALELYPFDIAERRSTPLFVIFFYRDVNTQTQNILFKLTMTHTL